MGKISIKTISIMFLCHLASTITPLYASLNKGNSVAAQLEQLKKENSGSVPSFVAQRAPNCYKCSVSNSTVSYGPREQYDIQIASCECLDNEGKVFKKEIIDPPL
jgi:hypothetical protein